MVKICISKCLCGRRGRKKRISHHFVYRCRNHCSCRYQLDLLSIPESYIEQSLVRSFS